MFLLSDVLKQNWQKHFFLFQILVSTMMRAVVEGVDLVLNLESFLGFWLFVGFYFLMLILSGLVLQKIRLNLENILIQILVNWRESDHPLLAQYMSDNSRERALLSEIQVKGWMVRRVVQMDTECVICLEVTCLLLANP